MDTKALIALIRHSAQAMGIDDDIAVAIAGHETGFVCGAARFESGWKYFYSPETFAIKLGISAETERVLQSTSWNAMQVMGSVAREFGYADHLTLLVDPNLGIFYGCKKLKKLYDTYEDEASVIAAYNAGSPRKVNGKFFNQSYVDEVTNRLTQLRALH